jgi:hypothetical protein
MPYRLWNELTIAVLEFIYHPSVKGNLTFAFYTDFVKRFQKSIDQINLLKIIREALASLSSTFPSIQKRKLSSSSKNSHKRKHPPMRQRPSSSLSEGFTRFPRNYQWPASCFPR